MSVKLAFKIFTTLIITQVVFSNQIKAQVKDAGLWTSVNAEVKLISKVNATLSQEFRFNENITELGAAFTDFGIQYKLNKNWRIAANYRFTQRRKVADYYSFRHRFYFDIKYAKKINSFGYSWRMRVQDQLADINRAADGGVPEYYLRNKFNVEMDTKKAYSPYVSFELFSSLNYPRKDLFSGVRVIAGVEYEINKHHKIDLYYMIQKELITKQPQTDFVVGSGYYFKF